MTDEQNTRLDEARAQSGEMFGEGDIRGLNKLYEVLDYEGALARKAGDSAYSWALRDEADMIADSIRFLEAEWRMTNGEAVTHG